MGDGESGGGGDGGMTTCLIALGGNQGDVPATFHAALERLAGDDLRVAATSRPMRSAPMGSSAGGEFVNAAALLETTLDPEALLARLHDVETSLGRRRTERWGPRPIDLDLITYGTRCSSSPALMLPHPGCWWRRFVLDPLVEIAGEVIHPEANETFAMLRQRLLVRPFVVGVPSGTTPSVIAAITARLGPLGSSVKWTNLKEPATIRLVPADSAVCSPVLRQLVVPADETEFVEMATAILTAALGEPRT